MRPRVPTGDQGITLGGLHQRVERRAERGDVAAERGLDGGVAVRRLDLGKPRGEAGHELQLDAEADQRLEVRGGVRWRVVELGVDQVDVPVDEDVFPGHEDVVEDDRRVDLVESGRQRIVEHARGQRRERAPRVEAQPVRVHRHHERDRIGLVTGHERRDVGDEEPVGHRRRGRDRVRAADHDPGRGLAHDSRMQERLRMAMGGSRPVDLRRHDRVRHVEVLVARARVEEPHVVAIARAAAVEEVAPGRKRGENARDVIGRAPHETERRLGPEPMDAPPGAEVVRRARDEPHVAVARSRRGLRERQRGIVLGGLRAVVCLGDPPDRLDERRVLGDVVDALAVEVHRPPVPEARDVRVTTAHNADFSDNVRHREAPAPRRRARRHRGAGAR